MPVIFIAGANHLHILLFVPFISITSSFYAPSNNHLRSVLSCICFALRNSMQTTFPTFNLSTPYARGCIAEFCYNQSSYRLLATLILHIWFSVSSNTIHVLMRDSRSIFCCTYYMDYRRWSVDTKAYCFFTQTLISICLMCAKAKI